MADLYADGAPGWTAPSDPNSGVGSKIGGGIAGFSDGYTPEVGTLQVLLSEGEIEGLSDGLKSVYLDGTPIQNSDDSLNFHGVALALVAGTNTQAAVKGITGTESETTVNVKVTHSTPVVRSITSNPSAVRVRIAIPSMILVDSVTGKRSGNTVTIKIEIQNASYMGGSWTNVDLAAAGVISGGPFSTRFTKTFRVELPAAGTWQVRVSRVSADDPTDGYHYSETWWDAYTEVVDSLLRYPNSSVLSVRVNAKQFQSIPKVTCKCKLMKIQVPKNYTPATQNSDGSWNAAVYATTGPGTSAGAWDGTFKTAWSSNPAWVFFDAATKTRYGSGDFLTVTGLDKWTLYTIGVWCDVMVADGKGGTEPRMTTNLYIQGQQNAITALGQLASIFWGVVYYASGLVAPVADTDSSPVALFTNANTEGGRFHYEGTARQARHTAAVVSYLNPQLGYATDAVVYEDAAGIARYGYNPLDLQAIGCTSPGQALRLGKWSILTELMSPETVTFATGLEGATLRPGDVIQVSDQHRAGNIRSGGRVADGATTSVIPLDSSVVLAGGVTYTLKLRTASGLESRTVSTSAGTVSSLTVSSPFTAAPVLGDGWLLQADSTAYLYRLLSIAKGQGITYTLTGLLHDPAKYTLLDLGSDDVLDRTPLDRSTTAPDSLAVTHSTRTLNDRLVQTLSASWTLDDAMSYSAQASRDYGPWTDMVITGATALLDGIQPGIWTVRVSGFWRHGGNSPYATATHTVTIPTEIATDTAAALAGLVAIADDGLLSMGEKPKFAIDYRAAVDAHTLLTNKAIATGTPYGTYATAFSTLQSYLLGLSPAYNDTTQDTPINASTWDTIWGDFYRENTNLLIKLSGAPPSTVDAVSSSSLNLTTNAAAPVLDGYTVSAGELVMASAQSTLSQNKVYTVSYSPPTGSAGYVYPSGGSHTGTNSSYSNDGNAYDGTLSTPTDGTYASLTSCADATNVGSAEVIYTGWTGTLTGTLHVKVTPVLNDQADGYGSTVVVYYSTDSGTTWTAMATYTGTDNGTMQDATATLTGLAGSSLRVKITTTSYLPRLTNPSPPPSWIYGAVAIGACDVNTVAVYVAASGSGNYSFTGGTTIYDGTLWRVRNGATYGGKIYSAGVASDNTVTLTQQAYDVGSYDVNCSVAGKPAAGAKVLIYPAPRPFTVQAQGHLGSCGTNNTTNPADFLVKKNGTTFGTLRFGSAGAFSLVSFSTASFATGDVLTIVAPSPQDATLADVGFTLRGNI